MRRLDDWIDRHEAAITRLLGIGCLLGCLYIAASVALR